MFPHVVLAAIGSWGSQYCIEMKADAALNPFTAASGHDPAKRPAAAIQGANQKLCGPDYAWLNARLTPDQRLVNAWLTPG